MASSSSTPSSSEAPKKADAAAEPSDDTTLEELVVDRLMSMMDEPGDQADQARKEEKKQAEKSAKKEAKEAAKQEKKAAKDAKKEKKKKDDEKKTKRPDKGAAVSPAKVAKGSQPEKDAEKAPAKAAKGRYEWPPDPQEERMTVAGAICDAQSRLQLSAYTDLRKWFQGEPSEMRHPDSSKPGLRQEELAGGTAAVSLDGLQNWSDDKGAGWRTMRKAVAGKNKTESRWFGANSWGSWRMAFLLARLQHQVWQRAAQAPEAPVAAQAKPLEAEQAPDGAGAGAGGEEWRNFSPKTIDSKLCLARTWNAGAGGQCQELRPSDSVLCYKHQRMAVSKQGLLNGLADGPIPEKRLKEFQEAVVRGLLGSGRKRAPAPPGKDERPARKRRKTSRKRTKSKSSKAAEQKETPKETRKKTPDPADKAAAANSTTPTPKRVRRSHRNRSSKPKEAAKEATLPPQRPVKEAEMFGRKPKQGLGRGRPKKTSESQKSAPESEPDPKQTQGEVRSRRFWAKMSDLEQQRRNQNKWTSVDDAMDHAMDQALNQIDVETQKGPLKSLVNAQGCIPMSGMAKAVDAMKSTPLEHRLQFTMVLRKTMLHMPSSTTQFMMQGGVAALRQWLKDGLPAPGQSTNRQQEEVVLECLGLLHEVPVTLSVLQSSGIGSTLMAIRNYVAPAMADAGELVNKWKTQFAKELKRSKSDSGDSKDPPRNPQGKVVPPAAQAASSGGPAPSTPPISRMSAPQLGPPVGPPAQTSTPPKRVNFATRMLWRKRERQRNAQNEMEATLRELFRLHQVLEEDPPDAKNLDLRHLDID